MAEVLIAEDESVLREAWAALLRAEGYRVRAVGDGAAAVAAFAASVPDLVLLDAMMPVLDGYAALERMRALDPSVPVLFLSAIDTDENRVRALRAGAADFMAKTLSPEEIRLRLRGALARSGHVAAALPFAFGAARVLPERYLVELPDASTVELTLRETELLRLLAANPRRALAWDWLRERLWGEAGTDAMVRKAVERLRTKLGAAAVVLKTKFGVGLVYEPEA